MSSNSDRQLDVVILAAGLGTRMKSAKAKVLHELGGLPLIGHVCRTARLLNPAKIHVVVGHQSDEVAAAVTSAIGAEGVTFPKQERQLGTGDAVMAVRSSLDASNSTALILSGDVPLIEVDTLRTLIEEHLRTGSAGTILSVRLDNPTGYGRIIRDSEGRFLRIVEHKDATSEQREISEINSGIYCFDTSKLFSALEHIEPKNQQGEYYLTDVAEILRNRGETISVYLHGDSREVSGINTRAELAEFENVMRSRTIQRLMLESGVTFIDPSHSYVDVDVSVGKDSLIHPDVHLEGKTTVGENCEIRSGSRVTNSKIGDKVTLKDHCVIVDSEVEANCSIGPFAHLRMNSRIEQGAAVGNFVEIKKSTLGRGSKSMHLTYLGDATIGEQTNIGAGTITCNYDGKNKHPTVIEDHVKIGSDTMLVAPVKVGGGSVTAAGSVVTKDVPPDSLVAGVPAVVKKHLAERKEDAKG